jgi:hypothetical protein
VILGGANRVGWDKQTDVMVGLRSLQIVISPLCPELRLSGLRRPTIDCVTLAHPTAATVPPRITKGYLEPGSTLKLGPFVCPTSAGKIVFPETGRYPPFHSHRLESIIPLLKGFLSTPA